MTNTFLNRVSAERCVLSIVNKRFPRAYQLTGLSSPAISRWRARLGLERTASISLILTSVAEQCQRLSHQSNETFMPMEQVGSEAVERHIAELKREIEKCCEG